jgi:peptidoglycan LD-endopeptidase CwlK
MNAADLLNRAEKKLSGLHPVVAEKARNLIKKAHSEGIYIIITQGLRTIEEQNRLYAQGRTKPGKIVTNARGGYSYHNFGLAFDFCVCDVVKGSLAPNWNVDRRWLRVGQIGKSLGLEWGGDWKSFKDYPHFQYTFGLSLAQLRSGKKPPIANAAKR